jgi:hypothetical protein
MSWTAPFTAVAGSVLTAAQWNTFVRDNMNETGPAKATTAGAYLVVEGTNQLAERVISKAVDTVSGTTTSTSFTDLDSPADIGPQVTVVTGSNALVLIHCAISNSGTGSARAGYEVSGSTSITGADNRGLGIVTAAGTTIIASCASWHTDLTPGSNTFTLKYRVSASTGTFSSRRIAVMPY